jgi:hypothetical protein
MCCPDRTHYGPIKHAIRHLTEVGARVIGVLVNDVDFSRRSIFSGYDYHYRYSYSYGGKYSYRQASEDAKTPPKEGVGDPVFLSKQTTFEGNPARPTVIMAEDE